MRRLSPYVALLMVYLMTPGAGEVTENLIHLVAEGHTAHALDDDAHTQTGEEHGCSGTFHLCECHTSAPFTVAARIYAVHSEPVEHSRLLWANRGMAADGYLTGLFRPPIG